MSNLKWPTKKTASIILWCVAAFNTMCASIVILAGDADWKIWTGLFIVPFYAWCFDWDRKH